MNILELFDKRFGGIEAELSEGKSRLKTVENTVTRIENDHGQKLGALFDGYKLNSEKLDRIEAEVSKHEEIATLLPVRKKPVFLPRNWATTIHQLATS